MWFVLGSKDCRVCVRWGKPSYLLEADDCDGDIAVVVVVGMMIGIDGNERRHWFLLIINHTVLTHQGIPMHC